MKWFPNSKGTVMGFVVGGFGGGAFVFNQIQVLSSIDPARDL